MWDWRFLGLLIFSSTVDYVLGRLIGGTADGERTKRKFLLALSLVVNLGILGFFKYANFFIDSVEGLFTFFGTELSVSSMNIILPVGISFYTFQSLSYIIDVYKKEVEPAKDIVAFLTFISFFPQLVAGPIERASHLLPQFNDIKKFDYEKAREGITEVFIGLFKKMVIADRLAVYVDSVFQNAAEGGTAEIAGFPSVLGLIFFGQNTGFQSQHQFPQALPEPFFQQFLGTLAYLIVTVDEGLYFHSFGRQPSWTFPYGEKPACGFCRERTVARGFLEFRHLGDNKCFVRDRA